AMGIASLVLLDDGEHVAGVEDQEILATDADLGPTELRVDDDVAHLHVLGDEIAGVLRPLPGTDSEDFALLGLLLGRVGDHQAAGRGLLGLAGPDHDSVFEGLQVHRWRLHGDAVSTRFGRVLTVTHSAWHSQAGSASRRPRS